ncbi:hypothetical protein CC85DRAFT_288924 [Cutaneotrichosporon oleaginosum]|uniref:CHCH domain-containing protein n=1 Tax=Cutaneotrichosporon oleaginosum TaxID=879819 RepID=A0A0J1AUT9_9TREE|nr:uncharacterized protein CC85DRAFT_288924 [Cutaneotrichosporon oleaginosum]KLT39049.1 hypothetical protein CC85DRAFT_288924 [Cutaneotrichosporon oleaginosum]TXT11834.1 hypothetical protein COLE_02244 [Cutaneotrichosporon oleaginosum]
MSFGRPGALSDTFKVSPPQRGSFPLDHDGECGVCAVDPFLSPVTNRARCFMVGSVVSLLRRPLSQSLTVGECKSFMVSYMKCLKANKNNSGACRPEARDYLGCRMDNDLMGRDDWSNLGLGDVPETAAKAASSAPSESAKASASSAGSGGNAANGSKPAEGSGGRWVPSERI